MGSRPLRLGELHEADQHAQEALAIAEELNQAAQALALMTLEEIAIARGDTVAAAEYKKRLDALDPDHG